MDGRITLRNEFSGIEETQQGVIRDEPSIGHGRAHVHPDPVISAEIEEPAKGGPSPPTGKEESGLSPGGSPWRRGEDY